MNNKIVEYDDKQLLESCVRGEKTVLVGGCFDIFHYGHLFFLKEAKTLGKTLIVALESDEFIRERKKKQPIHNQKQRAEILSHIDIIDVIILLPLFTNEDYDAMVRTISPAIIAVTKGDRNLYAKQQQAVSVRAKMVEIDFIEAFSSSNITKYASISGD